VKDYYCRVKFILGQQVGISKMLIMFILVAFLDMVGIGIIAPFTFVIGDPEQLSNYKSWELIKNIFSLITLKQEIIFLSISLMLIFLLRFVITILSQRKIISFGNSCSSMLKKKMLIAYNSLPYEYFIDQNSAHVFISVNSYTTAFAKEVLIPVLKMISNIFIMTGIIIVLLFTNWQSTVLILSIFGFLIYIYDILSRNTLSSIGREYNIASETMVKDIQHNLGSLKEIRALGVEQYFLDKLNITVEKQLNLAVKRETYAILPRYFFELVVLITIIGFIIVQTMFGVSNSLIVSTLAIYAFAAYRFLPSLIQFNTTLQQIRAAEHAINELYNDLKNLEASKSNKLMIPTKSLNVNSDVFKELIIKNVYYSYPNSKKVVLKNVTFSVKQGQFVGVLGRSGSGKTTLMDILLGLLLPQKGSVSFNSRNKEYGLSSWNNLVAYIPQQLYLLDDTLRMNIAFGVNEKDIDDNKLYQAARLAQLTDLIQDLPDGLETQIGERGIRLSGGQRQRVSIARAFYHRREVLILDEITSELDEETENEVMNSIKILKGKCTLIIITHRQNTLKYCDKIIRVDKGMIIQA